MNKKEEIFKTAIDKLAGVGLHHSTGILDSYDFDLKEAHVTLQTDFDNHLETLIEFKGRSFSIGGQYMPKLGHWEKWSSATTEGLSYLLGSKTFVEEEWLSKQGEYIGGLLILHTDGGKEIVFADALNNLLPLFKKKRRREVRL